MSVHDSNQSSVSTIVDWSSLVIEPENDGDDKGIPDEKPVDENAMFTLLGLKTDVDERGTKPGPIVVPTPAYDEHETKEVAIDVHDKAPEEPLISWDERYPTMEIGTPYPHMDAFRKAIKQFAINGEFEYGTKKNEPKRFQSFCKGESIKGEPCKWSLTATWKRDENCVMVITFFIVLYIYFLFHLLPW
jgi:hypothetical protein